MIRCPIRYSELESVIEELPSIIKDASALMDCCSEFHTPFVIRDAIRHLAFPVYYRDCQSGIQLVIRYAMLQFSIQHSVRYWECLSGIGSGSSVFINLVRY